MKQIGAILPLSDDDKGLSNKTAPKRVNQPSNERRLERDAARSRKDKTMTFALGLFATLISAMFVATLGSSVIAAGREMREAEDERRLSIF